MHIGESEGRERKMNEVCVYVCMREGEGETDRHGGGEGEKAKEGPEA